MMRSLFFFFLSWNAFAGWQSIGPFGGAAEAIAINPADPANLVAATRNGLVYISGDAGRSWKDIRFPAQLTSTVHAMLLDPAHPATWYIGVSTEDASLAGIFKTEDSGATWKLLPGMKGTSVYSLSFWQKDSSVIAAGGEDGVYLTKDSGENWQRISPNTNRDLQPITALTFDPGNSEVIYAGTPHLPWKTSDGGKNWHSIHSGMIDDSDVFSVHVDMTKPDHVFASACSGIYRSGDAGGRWAKMMGVPRSSRRTYIITQDPFTPSIIYAGTSSGFWQSSNSGDTWKMVSSHIVKSIAFHPKTEGELYLATDDAGILVTHDRGVTSKAINEGFVNRHLPQISFADGAMYTSSIYELKDGGIYKSANHGNSWDRIATPAQLHNENILAMTSLGQGKGPLLAVGFENILKSSDGGRTWLRLGHPWGGSKMVGLRNWTGDSKTALLASSNGIFVTRDGGAVWKAAKVKGDSTLAVRSIYASGTSAVVATTGALFISTDAGTAWSPFSRPREDSEIYDLALRGGPNGAILAATSHGLFRSIDQAKTWKSAGIEAGTVSSVIWHPSRAAEAYAVQYGRVYRSIDGGIVWNPLERKGMEGVTIRSLAIDATLPDRLFVLTASRGIFWYDVSTIGRPDGPETVPSH